LTEEELPGNREWTFGVGVTNPGGPPVGTVSNVLDGSGTNNFWGLMLKSYEGLTVDANMRVPGVDLRFVDIRYNEMGWDQALGEQMSRIGIKLQWTSDMQGGEIETILLASPPGVMFNNAETVSILPTPLPILAEKGVHVAGTRLLLVMDRAQTIKAQEYEIRFDVKNPKKVPVDNTWYLQIKRGAEMKYTTVLPGYTYGQSSPFPVQEAAESSFAVPKASVAISTMLAMVFAQFAWLWMV
jgi:hypothetical protein